MNRGVAGFVLVLILGVVLACDSPPWSRFVVSNQSPAEIRVRFYTKDTTFASPCIYSPEQWKEKARSCSGTQKEDFVIAHNQWLETKLPPGSALEIVRYRYPDVEKNIESTFGIDRLDIEGSSGNPSWSGRNEIFQQFEKEDTSVLSPSYGMSPKYVIYYR